MASEPAEGSVSQCFVGSRLSTAGFPNRRAGMFSVYLRDVI